MPSSATPLAFIGEETGSVSLWNRCRSEPQIAQLVTLTIASRGSSISGSATVSHRMSSLPCQTRARIFVLPSPHGHPEKPTHTLLLRSAGGAKLRTLERIVGTII